MPLRALLEGRELLAPLMSEEEWAELKKTLSHEKLNITLPCCNKPGFMRVSKLGTRHFVHSVKPDSAECNWKPETAEHLLAKTEIVRACKKAGYDVSTEVTGPDWRADVLATKKNIKVAFEVQLSAQSFEETKERTERYKRDGIRACWLMGKKVIIPDEPQKDIPFFILDISDDKVFSIRVCDNNHTIRDFIEALLLKRVRFCKNLKSRLRQKLHIVFYEKECWRCKKKTHVYFIKKPYQSFCGNGLGGYVPIGSMREYVFRPEVLEAVYAFLKTDEAASLRVGEIKNRYSKMESCWSYSFGCFWCDAPFGDRFLYQEIWEAYHNDKIKKVSFEREVILRRSMIQEMSHWCFSEDGTFCCQ